MARFCARHHRTLAVAFALMVACSTGACSRRDSAAPSSAGQPAVRPSILLVTLDTTRADAIGPDAPGVATPAFTALAATGQRFTQAYTTAPETLPAHCSIMTGLYPAGHGVHENARHLGDMHPVLASRLKDSGYRTAAFVSAFVLSRRFGLARGFDVYDDALAGGAVERPAKATTDAAIAHLEKADGSPQFLWVHYFDPHTPYAPAGGDLRSRYLREVESMDAEMARLLASFQAHANRRRAPNAVIVVADHGEGLGDHGELQHGNLLYQPTMRVPLVIAGTGVAASTVATPVSTRRVFHTVLDFAAIDSTHSLRTQSPSSSEDVVLAEGMKPFLGYGWQPQIMAVAGRHKAIFAGQTEVYDVIADPSEANDLGAGANVSAALRRALDDYPVPSSDAAPAAQALSAEARRSLASLGYVSASAAPIVRKDAPRPVDMVPLFATLEEASSLFVNERYADVIPLLETIVAKDSHNLDAILRLATAHSALGHERPALDAFTRAAAIAPRSPDVRMYLALHYAKGKAWREAVPQLERIVAETPERLPAVEALAVLRERQGRIADAVALRQQVLTRRTPTAADLTRLGELAMAAQQTPVAIDAFERARALAPATFTHDLELGVLYLAARRFDDARQALDRIPASHPEYPMVLFKRAQVSVLLREPDSAARIARARQRADRTTKALIEREALFK